MVKILGFHTLTAVTRVQSLVGELRSLKLLSRAKTKPEHPCSQGQTQQCEYFLIKLSMQQVPSPSPLACTILPRPRKDPDTQGPGVGWSVCGASSGWEAAGKTRASEQGELKPAGWRDHDDEAKQETGLQEPFASHGLHGPGRAQQPGPWGGSQPLGWVVTVGAGNVASRKPSGVWPECRYVPRSALCCPPISHP